MKRIYPKEEVCIACHLCEVYCVGQHSRSKDLVKAFKKELPRPLPRIRVQQRGEVSFALQCRHCEEPPCVHSCLTGALFRDPETGIVSVSEEKCVGCWTCLMFCPYSAIRPDFDRKKIVKCDLCFPLNTPVCVANCPNEALVCWEGKKE